MRARSPRLLVAAVSVIVVTVPTLTFLEAGSASASMVTRYGVGVASSSPGQLAAFVTGTGGGLFYKARMQGQWGDDWQRLDGNAKGGPVAASMSAGRVDVFVRGTDNAIYQGTLLNNAWSGLKSLGGSTLSDPAVVSPGPNRLELFVRGGNNDVVRKSFANGVWGPWVSIGGTTYSGPGAASSMDGKIEVFARGTNNALFIKESAGNGATWSAWKSLGGVITSEPAATRVANGQLRVAVRGTNDAAFVLTYANGVATPFTQIPSTATSRPAIVSTTAGEANLFVISKSGQPVVSTDTGSGWGGWLALGGVAGVIPTTSTTVKKPPSCTAGKVSGLSGHRLERAVAVMHQAKVKYSATYEKKAALVALMTAYQESGFWNYANSSVPASTGSKYKKAPYYSDRTGRDHDSVGIFQQRYPLWGSLDSLMNPSTSAGKFYSSLSNVSGWSSMSPAKAAQAVQRSAFPTAYAKWQDEAQALINARFACA